MKKITIHQKNIGNINYFEIGSVKYIDRIVYIDLVRNLLKNKYLYCLIKKPRWQIKAMAEEGVFKSIIDNKVYLLKVDNQEKLIKLYEHLVAFWNSYFLFSGKADLIDRLQTKVNFLFDSKKEKFNKEIFNFIDSLLYLGPDDLSINVYTIKHNLEYIKSLLKDIIKKEFEFRESEKQLFGEGLLVE